MLRVVDASAAVAMLTDSGAAGEWAAEELQDHHLAGPHLFHAEVANVLRRSAAAGQISQDTAAQAYGDLLRLRITLYPYAPFAERIWELRANLSTYDAWYVSIAELLDAELVTLDHRLTRAHGPRCAFVAYGS